MPPAHKIGLRGFFYAAVCPSYMLTSEPSIWLTTLSRPCRVSAAAELSRERASGLFFSFQTTGKLPSVALLFAQRPFQQLRGNLGRGPSSPIEIPHGFA